MYTDCRWASVKESEETGNSDLFLRCLYEMSELLTDEREREGGVG